MEADFVAACNRIQVDPRAERAAAAMRRSSYKRALRMLALMLTAKPDDPYASYLAGMCAAELGQFEEGAQYFASVLKSEPTSHASRLLSAYCKNAAKQKPPLSDETVLACFEAGLEEATKHLAPPETNDDDDLTARLIASVFSVPDIVRDPLLYVLDHEALNGRGPRAFEVDRFVAAAQESNNTYELFLAWYSTADDEIAAKIEERLDGPKHAETMKALLFLMKYYGKDKLYRQRGEGFEKDLAELQKLMPDEGLWLMLGVESQDGEHEKYLYPVLTERGFALFERASSSAKLTDYHRLTTDAAIRLMQRLRFPWARQAGERLCRQAIKPIGSVSRNVVLRAKSLARKRFDTGDTDGGLRVTRTIKRYSDQLTVEPGEMSGFGRLIRASYRRYAGELVIENLSSSRTDNWLAHQRLRLEAVTLTARQRGLDPSIVAAVIPLTAINEAEERLLDGRWPEWKLTRVSRTARAESPLETAKSFLTYGLDGSVRAERLLGPGILKLHELLPLLRQFRDIQLDDDKLWPLVWTLGELEDKESLDWLIGQLSDKREWLRITAAEALEKITAMNHGQDAAAWRKALGKQP